VLFLALAAGGVTLDLVTKWLAFARVGPPGNKNPIWQGVFSFTTSYNKGALWGFARELPYANLAFAGLSILAGAAIVYWLFVRGGAKDRTLAVALGLIMAGTMGNCFDRLVYGHVRDFIYFDLINWPIFNFADSMLVCGAGILMLQAIFVDPHRADAPIASASATAPEIGRD
jgi:signal peptidase II